MKDFKFLKTKTNFIFLPITSRYICFKQGMEWHRSRGEWVHCGCEGGDSTADGSYAVAVKCHHFDPGEQSRKCKCRCQS